MGRVLITGLSGTGKSSVVRGGRPPGGGRRRGRVLRAADGPGRRDHHPRFDLVILLTAPAAMLVERLTTRTTNDFGKDAGELARTLELQRTVEPLPRRGADLVVDTRAPLDAVVDAIVRHVAAS